MVFTDGLVPTVAELNDAIGPVMQAGFVELNPLPSTPTMTPVVFPRRFRTVPRVQVTPREAVGGSSSLKSASARSITTTGCTIVTYRANSNLTRIAWAAVETPQPITATMVTAGHLNQGAGSKMVCRSGAVSITPGSANVPASATISFGVTFLEPPQVMTSALLGTPSAILGTGATEASKTGAKIWLCRTSTLATTVHWIAVGRLP